MAGFISTKSSKSNGGKSEQGPSPKPRHRSVQSDSLSDMLFLQHTLGNHTVGQLLKHSANDHRNSPHNSRAALVQHASMEAGKPLEPSVRRPMEQQLGADLSGVRVHSGTASAHAAESLGARAYTVGSNIYLGPGAQQLGELGKRRLLAHEAVHTIQQGGRPVTLQGKMRVSHPRDRAEVEANRIAESITSASLSRSLAIRDRIRATPVASHVISRVAAPLIQRDLKGPHTVKDGTFTLNLKTESHAGAKSGMSGTIKFRASEKAPDSTSIRLLQIARLEDLTTGKDYVWTGGEANRNKVMTAEDKDRGVTPGYFVDVLHKNRSPRTKIGDPKVSPYYIDDYLALKSPNNLDGSKKGKTIKEASLWDYPGWSQKSRFSFETAAKAADTDYIYATVRWGFTISDGATGKVEKEHAKAYRGPSATFGEAVKQFNEFYRNPGASTAPK